MMMMMCNYRKLQYDGIFNDCQCSDHEFDDEFASIGSQHNTTDDDDDDDDDDSEVLKVFVVILNIDRSLSFNLIIF